MNNVSGAVHRGYTAAQGGHAQAVIDYKDHLARQKMARTRSLEGVAVLGTAPSSHLPHTTHNNKRSQALQPTEDVPVSKRQKREPSFPSSQRHISYDPCPTREAPPISVAQDSGECVVDHGSAEEKSELETSQPEVPRTSEPPHECTNGVDSHDSDAENEVATKPLHMNLSQSMSSRSPDSELRLCEEQATLVGTAVLGGDVFLVALKQHQFETTVKLREGMRVILLVNLSQGLVNGSQGIIIGFEPASTNKEYFKTTGEHGNEKRSQLDAFMSRNKNAPWPIVEFSDGRKQTIYPHCMINESGKSHPWSLLSRTQVPLMAAWAMTKHKAQGMTLDQVVEDLADTFEKGHACVALSRASSLAGLKVENFGRFDKCPARKVMEFLEENLGTF